MAMGTEGVRVGKFHEADRLIMAGELSHEGSASQGEGYNP